MWCLESTAIAAEDSLLVPPKYVEDASTAPDEVKVATKASHSPAFEFWIASTRGRSVDQVSPVIYPFPSVSTATLFTVSKDDPPKNVLNMMVPEWSSFMTKISPLPRYFVVQAWTVGKSGEEASPATQTDPELSTAIAW